MGVEQERLSGSFQQSDISVRRKRDFRRTKAALLVLCDEIIQMADNCILHVFTFRSRGPLPTLRPAILAELLPVDSTQ